MLREDVLKQDRYAISIICIKAFGLESEKKIDLKCLESCANPLIGKNGDRLVPTPGVTYTKYKIALC
jgi:hypothetical protein